MVVATLNRTLKSLLFAKLAGEDLLRLPPRGPHDWRRFSNPDELAVLLARHGGPVVERVGVGFNPFRAQERVRNRGLHNVTVIESATVGGKSTTGKIILGL